MRRKFALAVFGLAAVLCGVAFAEIDSVSSSVLKSLKRAGGQGVVWDLKGSVRADFTCDGKPDLVVLGRKHGSVLVAVVSAVGNARPGKPSIDEYPIDRSRQDAFCAMPKRISIVPHDCNSDAVGPLEGCKASRKCHDFSIEDDECDPVNYYWNSQTNALAWWRA